MSRFPPLLKDALIVTEDQNFERHWGVDVTGIGRAVFKGLISGRRIQGTSTLTQQLSRLCFLNSEKSFKRKFQELLFSIQIERFYTKRKSLRSTLTKSHWGIGTTGLRPPPNTTSAKA